MDDNTFVLSPIWDNIRQHPKIMDYRREDWEKEYREGWEEGRKEEREAGIRIFVETLQEMSVDKDTAIRRLMSKYLLDPNTAREKVDRYWLPN